MASRLRQYNCILLVANLFQGCIKQIVQMYMTKEDLINFALNEVSVVICLTPIAHCMFMQSQVIYKVKDYRGDKFPRITSFNFLPVDRQWLEL